MPDWSYQTLFRPLLFQLPPKLARDLTFQAMGGLSRLPGGSFVIRTMGHMESSPMLTSTLSGIPLQYPVGLTGSLDPEGIAHQALAQFGFGFIEIGPITLGAAAIDSMPLRRDVSDEAIVYSAGSRNRELHQIKDRLARNPGHRLPLMLHVKSSDGCSPSEARAELICMMEELSYYAAAFYIETLDAAWSVQETINHLQALQLEARSLPTIKPMFLYLPLDYSTASMVELLTAAVTKTWSGAVIGDVIDTAEGEWAGRTGKTLCIEKTRLIREH